MANENNKLVLVSVDKHLQNDTVSSQHGFWQLKPILAAFRNLTCLTLIAPDCALPDLLIQKTTAPTLETPPPWGPISLAGRKHVKTAMAKFVQNFRPTLNFLDKWFPFCAVGRSRGVVLKRSGGRLKEDLDKDF